MKGKFGWLMLAAAACLTVAGPASASTVVYNNGPINGTESAWTINYGYAVSDSFTLSNGTTLTGAQIGLWLYPGDAPQSVDWSIGSSPNTSNDGSGVGELTSTFYGTAQWGYSLFESTFSLNDPLAAGTYYLTLQNASTSYGDPAYWDINQGPSAAWESVEGNLTPYLCQQAIGYSGTCSDSFQLYGTSSRTPEPASLLLLGTGLVGLARMRRKAR